MRALFYDVRAWLGRKAGRIVYHPFLTVVTVLVILTPFGLWWNHTHPRATHGKICGYNNVVRRIGIGEFRQTIHVAVYCDVPAAR